MRIALAIMVAVALVGCSGAGDADDAGIEAGSPDAGAARPYVEVTVTLVTNYPVVAGHPYTHAFDTLVGEPLDIHIYFDSVGADLHTTPVDVTFSPVTVLVENRISDDVRGQSGYWTTGVVGMPSAVDFQLDGPAGSEVFTMEATCTSAATAGSPYGCTGTFSLRRVEGSPFGVVTDEATGNAHIHYVVP